MELIVKSRNITITDALRTRLNRKIGGLDRYLPLLKEAEVELTREDTKSAQYRILVQVVLRGEGTLLKAEERSSDVLTAVDTVTQALRHQVEKTKGKVYHKRGSRANFSYPPEEGEKG